MASVSPESCRRETEREQEVEESNKDSSAATGFRVLGGFESRPVNKVQSCKGKKIVMALVK